jgi:hypothetical protein
LTNQRGFVQYKSTSDSILENYSSFIYNKFLAIRNFKSQKSIAEKGENIFAIVKIAPDDAFSIKRDTRARTLIFDAIQSKGLLKEQYNDLKTYLIAIDSTDFINDEILREVFDDLTKTFARRNSGLPSVTEKRSKVMEAVPMVELINDMRKKLRKHTKVLIRIEKQLIITNESVLGFLINRIKLQVSLLKVVNLLHAALYKIIKGFGIINQKLENVFRANNSVNIKVSLRYFIPAFDCLVYLKKVLQNENELFNIKRTLGSFGEGLIEMIGSISEFLAVDKENLEIAVGYFYKIQKSFGRNEVISKGAAARSAEQVEVDTETVENCENPAALHRV